MLKAPAIPSSLTSSAADKKRRLSRGSNVALQTPARLSVSARSQSHASPPSVNDDSAELAALAAHKAQQRAKAKLAAASKIDRSQLTAIYAQCMKLANSNKINQKNVWGLQLIDVMGDVIQSNANDTDDGTKKENDRPNVNASPSTSKGTEDKTDESLSSSLSSLSFASRGKPKGTHVNFAQASCTLDASVMIYSSRVDSVHKDTYKVLGGLSRSDATAATETTSDNDNEGEDDENGETKKRSKRSRRPTGVASTIETRVIEKLNMKTLERSAPWDPLFKKMSAAFDAGGAQGLLMHALPIHSDCSIALDSDTRVWANKKTAFIDSSLSVDVDVDELRTILQSATSRLALPLCPGLEALRNIQRTLTGDASEHVQPADMTDDSLELNIVMESHESFEPMPAPELPSFAALHAELDAAIAEENKLDQLITDDCGVEGVDAGYSDDGFPMAGFENLQLSQSQSVTTVPSTAAAMIDFDSALSSASSLSAAAWAGVSHWKLQSAPRAATSTATVKPGRSKAKVPFALDFRAPFTPLSLLVPVTKKHRARSLNLSAATLNRNENSRSALCLPEDCQYRVARLQHLSTKPNIKIKIQSRYHSQTEGWREHAVRQSVANFAVVGDQTQANTTPDDEDELAFVEPNSSFASVDNDDDIAATDDLVIPSSYTAIEAPALAAKSAISFARVAKRVDVAALKETLWAVIDDQCTNLPSAAPTANERTVAFQSAINAMSDAFPSESLAAVSVPYCFICLLHLCNEKGLTLTQNDAPAQAEDGAASAGINDADRCYNLHTLSVVAH